MFEHFATRRDVAGWRTARRRWFAPGLPVPVLVTQPQLSLTSRDSRLRRPPGGVDPSWLLSIFPHEECERLISDRQRAPWCDVAREGSLYLSIVVRSGEFAENRHRREKRFSRAGSRRCERRGPGAIGDRCPLNRQRSARRGGDACPHRPTIPDSAFARRQSLAASGRDAFASLSINEAGVWATAMRSR